MKHRQLVRLNIFVNNPDFSSCGLDKHL